MKRVVGIGGVFFKAKNPAELQAWYKRHLGINVEDWGGTAFNGGTTIWSIGADDPQAFHPSQTSFMINYRVEDVKALVEVLKSEGCQVLPNIDESEYGKFAWVMDPEGNKVELWEPPTGSATPTEGS